MANSYTTTNSYTYTKPRIDVLEDHFQLFFACAGMSDNDIKKHLKSIAEKELKAVGVYLEQAGYMIAEVEMKVDWNIYDDNIRVSGNMFDTDIPGWKNGTAPEAYILVQKLASEAKRLGLSVRHWILVSDSIRSSKSRHKKVCDSLGYNYGSSVASWKDGSFSETSRQINGLPEATITTRMKKN